MTITFTETEYTDFCKHLLQLLEKECIEAAYEVVGMSSKQEAEIHSKLLLKSRNYFSYLKK